MKNSLGAETIVSIIMLQGSSLPSYCKSRPLPDFESPEYPPSPEFSGVDSLSLQKKTVFTTFSRALV